ncbi:MAG: DUF4339 domain-containing protein [Planctomycetaceae bacterium]
MYVIRGLLLHGRSCFSSKDRHTTHVQAWRGLSKMTYRYRHSGLECGPVSFRELVLLVAGGELGPDDKVRTDEDRDWKHAIEVPGLFHMAGLADVVEAWTAERSGSHPDRACPSEVLDRWADSRAMEPETTRQPHVQACPHEHGSAESLTESDSESDSTDHPKHPDSMVAAVAAETLESIDHRVSSRLRRTRFFDWIERAFSGANQWLLLRILSVLLAANVAAFGLLKWSETEAQRHPDESQLTSGMRNFPLFGKCSAGQFFFLTVNSMLLAGAAGFAAARGLEAIADD